MEITFENLHRAIAALRQCAKENDGRQTDTGAIRVTDLCNDVADYLQRLVDDKDGGDEIITLARGYQVWNADGSVTDVNARMGDAPRSRAASVSEGSMPTRRAFTTRQIYGTQKVVWVSTSLSMSFFTPAILNIAI